MGVRVEEPYTDPGLRVTSEDFGPYKHAITNIEWVGDRHKPIMLSTEFLANIHPDKFPWPMVWLRNDWDRMCEWWQRTDGTPYLITGTIEKLRPKWWRFQARLIVTLCVWGLAGWHEYEIPSWRWVKWTSKWGQ